MGPARFLDKLYGNLEGNATSATKLQTSRAINGTNFDGTTAITTANWGTARTLTIGNTGKSVNGSTNYNWTHAEIGATVSNTWGAGTSSGPILTTTINGISSAATIPAASTTASGIVTTAEQSFIGAKKFASTVYANNGLYVGSLPSGDNNFIAFFGTTGDGPGSYNHTFIGENLYGGSEGSELVIFKGNDIDSESGGSPGPDRIRHIAARHLFQTYDSALSGSWTTICDSTVPVTKFEIRPTWIRAHVTSSFGTSSASYALNAASFYCDDWVRTKGAAGWFSQDYGGGWHMNDTTWIRAYNDKKVYVSNTNNDAIYTAGGVKAHGGFTVVQSDVSWNIQNKNSTYTHYTSSASTGHWFNKAVYVAGDIYAGTNYNDKVITASRGIQVFSRNDIGTSPNFDNPNVNGFFEVRSTSETSGESGTKPFNSFGFFLNLKSLDAIAMFQLAAPSQGELMFRARQQGNVTMSGIAWKTLLSSSNYTNYTVTKTGTGASGTWGISITGSAAKATADSDGNTISSTYLKKSGGTMNGTAVISWPDTGNWSNNNSGVTFPVARGGFQWNGQSDYIKLFAEETASDQLNLVCQFGDDSNPALVFRNTSGTQVARIGADGTIAASTFSGALSGNAATASAWQTARTFTIGNKGQSVNGSSNITWNLLDILYNASSAIGTTSSWDIITPGVYAVSSGSEFTGTNNPEAAHGGLTPYRWGQLIVSRAESYGLAQFYVSHRDSDQSSYGIKYRTGWNSSYMTTWSSILDSTNYINYTVTKTGGGASGTWGINISGKAANATYLVEDESFNLSRHSFQYFNISGTAGAAVSVNDTPTTAWWHIQRHTHANSAGFYTDVAIPFNDNQIYYKRVANGSLVNGGWVMLYDTKSIIYSSTEPTSGLKVGMIWLKPV